MPSIQGNETTACPLCGSWGKREWGAENGYEAVRCTDCGLVYVTPRPKLSDISEANKIGEHRTTNGALNVVYRRSGRKIRHYRRIVQRMFSRELAAGAPLSWLDIGAGYGEFVEAAAQALPEGSTVEGIEPMQPKVEQARALNLPVSSIPLARVTSRFDVVSLINVFSHLPDFDDFLREIRRVMKPSGVLLLETGNAGDLPSAKEYPDRLYLPDHLMFAGVGHMRRFLEQGGLQVSAVYALRLDTAGWMAKNVAKRMIGRDAKLSVPYSSPFRTVFYKANLHSPVSPSVHRTAIFS